MSNLQNIPIVDKNGVATSRNKKIDVATGSTDRVAAIGKAPAKEKRLKFKPTGYDRGNWKDTDIVELGKQDENDVRKIYFNGKSIGSLSSYSEANYRKIGGGSRLISYTGGESTYWTADPSYAEDKFATGSKSEYGRRSRSNAVTDYVNDYLENIKRHQENLNYIESGGIAFNLVGNYGNKKLVINDKEVDIPSGYRPDYKQWSFNNYSLHTAITLDSSSNRGWFSFNDQEDGASLVINDKSSGERTYYSIDEDGSLTAKDDDSQTWIDDHKADFRVFEKFAEQVTSLGK